MKLLRLHLDHFRNYAGLEIDLRGADRHLFVGRNGSGKTNLLESACVLSLTKSNIAPEEEAVRQWGTDFYRVRGEARSDAGEECSVEIVSQESPRREKACFVNDVRVSAAHAVGRVPAVLFLPQDLQLFQGPPTERRRFLDQILCQVSPAYFAALAEYQRILRQRNALLKRIAARDAEADELAPWDGEAAQRGSELTVARLELIEAFNLSVAEEVRGMGECWTEVHVRYERSGTERDRTALERELLGLLERHRSRDVALQATTVGPHRDDWYLEVDGHSLTAFASRGQQRIAVLGLLSLQASFLELRRGERPVLLFDDIFSELDAAHQERVLASLDGNQILMTALSPPPGLAGVRVWEVEEGVRMVPDGRSPVPA